jgi:hypothetical protein
VLGLPDGIRGCLDEYVDGKPRADGPRSFLESRHGADVVVTDLADLLDRR